MKPSLVDIESSFDEQIFEAVTEKIAELMDKTVDEIEMDYQIVRLHPLTVLIENNYFNNVMPCRMYSIEELNNANVNLFIGTHEKLYDAETLNINRKGYINAFIESLTWGTESSIDDVIKTVITKQISGDKIGVSYSNQDREVIALIPKNSNLLKRDLTYLNDEQYAEFRQWLVDNDLIQSYVTR